MSDDIVKRLHSQAHADEYAGTYYMTKLHFPLLREAADEIERLTAERDKWKLQAQYETDTAQAAIDEIERRREENRKLRYEVMRASVHDGG